IEFFVAPDQRCAGASGTKRLKATLNCARADYLPRLHRLREAFERRGAEVAILKQPARQAPGISGNHDGVRGRQTLQPRGQVRRLADYCFFLRRAAANKITDHDQARGDTDPNLQLELTGERKRGCAERFNKGQAGANCALSVVLVCVWVTKV